MTTPQQVQTTTVAKVRPIQMRRNWSADWRQKNPVLAAGEIGMELDSGRFKMGDGVTKWLDLPYFSPNEAGDSPIAGISMAQFQAHIDSLTPHPTYDDGPSFKLLYENAKV